MNKQEELVKEQLSRVQFADLSNYDESANTFYISKINQIKLKVGNSYIIKVKDSIKEDEILKSNYNQGKNPPINYLLIDVLNILGKIIKVNSIEYDIVNNQTIGNLWGGYLTIKDVEIIKEM